MDKLGIKIAEKRRTLGLTQIEFAEKMHVTRQTVSRWEAGSAMPDIDKIGEIADILGVSCDYLLKDEAAEEGAVKTRGIGKLLRSLTGKTVRFVFFDGEADVDLYNTPCRIIDFEGNWMRIAAETKKGSIEKLIPVSSVLSLEIVKEEN
ncbi:MAG: helix-turn-helix domain-containing protein [Lachnospiraceae bacterium]|nr:helix-turn-helix domain-containing protein [Lachnospiraceae bacterium]